MSRSLPVRRQRCHCRRRLCRRRSREVHRERECELARGLTVAAGMLAPAFGSAAVLPVHPKPAAPAIRVLLRAIKGGRAPLVLLPALALNGDDGVFDLCVAMNWRNDWRDLE